MMNETAERENDFWTYYHPELHDYVRKIFAPFMREWNYEFSPEEKLFYIGINVDERICKNHPYFL